MLLYIFPFLQAKFEYSPHGQELVESIWEFLIPFYSIQIPFLLVGHMKEPSVHLDRVYLNFKSMLVGEKQKHRQWKEFFTHMMTLVVECHQ